MNITYGVLMRLFSGFSLSSGGCWDWKKGKTRKGYGRIKVGGTTVAAHRAMATALWGSVPDGLVVMHTCDNPGCVNPSHLRVGTQSENILDAFRKGRKTMPMRRLKLEGKRFGGWVVESFAGVDGSNHALWRCVHDDGRVRNRYGHHLLESKVLIEGTCLSGGSDTISMPPGRDTLFGGMNASP